MYKLAILFSTAKHLWIRSSMLRMLALNEPDVLVNARFISKVKVMAAVAWLRWDWTRIEIFNGQIRIQKIIYKKNEKGTSKIPKEGNAGTKAMGI